jgi:HAD superfamily hydrolase (TIGR01509 family)
MKMVKPDLEIYRNVISELKVEPERILFLDDNLRNIQASKKLGINGHHVKGIQQVCQTLVNMGVIYA